MPRRNGLSLFELMVVLAVLLLLGLLLAPTLTGMTSDHKLQAGCDVLRSRMADAKALAMEQNRPYRLAVNTAGTKVRIGPDTSDFASLSVGAQPVTDDMQPVGSVIEEPLPLHVTIKVVESDTHAAAPREDGGLLTITTFYPDGTCKTLQPDGSYKQDNISIEVHEPGSSPMVVRLRGMTGNTDIQHEKHSGGSQ